MRIKAIPSRGQLASAMAAMAVCIGFAGRVAAQCDLDALLHTWDNPDLLAGGRFGISVAIEGNKALVGAQFDRLGVSTLGKAFLLDATTGALLQTFENPDPWLEEQFGTSVAISGNNVLIGAYWDESSAIDMGRAHLFDATTGALLRTFNNPSVPVGGDEYDEFGRSLAIEGNNILAGAPGYDDPGVLNVGRAYLLNASTGALLRTFANPTPEGLDLFGGAVALSGNYVLVGAAGDDSGPGGSESAYLFNATTGALLQTLNSPHPAPTEFGYSVAMDGTDVLVGAPNQPQGVIFGVGRAYRFFAATGALLQTYLNPNPGPANGDHFGDSVAIEGNNVLVGASEDDAGGENNTGSAYLFNTSTGLLLHTYNNPIPPPVGAGDRFGVGVAISGELVLVGAHLAGTVGNDSGSAYLYGCPAPNATRDWADFE